MRNKTLARNAAIICLVGLLTACGGGGGGGGGTSNAGGGPSGSDTGGGTPTSKPLEVTAASIAEGAVATDPRKTILLTFNTNLSASGITDRVLLSDGSNTYPITVTPSGQLLEIASVTGLHTRTDYRLTVKAGAAAADGSVLKNDYVLHFRTEFAVYEFRKLTPVDPSVDRNRDPRIVIADVNGDGRPDLVEMAGLRQSGTFVENGYTLNIYLQNASGGFDKFQQLDYVADQKPISKHFANLIALDIDGDGKPELLVPEFRGDDNATAGIRIFKAGGDGKFVIADFIPTIYSETVQVLDVDGDGKLDLVGANHWATDQTIGGFQVLLNTKTGLVQLPPVSLPAGNYEFGVGDLDQDGKRELVVNGVYSDPFYPVIADKLLIYSQSTPGVFALNQALTDETLGFCANFSDCRGMKIVDWNAGKPALVFRALTLPKPNTSSENLMLVFSRRPTGGLVNNIQDSLGNMETLFDVQDLDGDGVPDLLAVGADWNMQANIFSVAGGKPGFALDYSNIFVIPVVDTMHPEGVAIGDIDGDGKPDIVFDSYQSGIVVAKYMKY